MNGRVEIKATYRIATPMFIGGAEQKATSIRPPSFKGALRFWWRALALGRVANTLNGQVKPEDFEKELLKKVHDEETRMFGNAADEKKGFGQGVFLLSIKDDITITETPPKTENTGFIYLLGQGLNDRGNFRRGYINENGQFTTTLLFRPNVKEDSTAVKEIKQALIALGLMGGLGSRSRRGMGSVTLTELKVHVGPNKVVSEFIRPSDNTQLEKFINNTISESVSYKAPSAHEPAYTAISSVSQIWVGPVVANGSSIDLLNSIGEGLNNYRTNDTKNTTRSKKFQNDHNLVDAFLKKKTPPPSCHPDRVVFGLPHNYFFSSIFKSKKEEYKKGGKEEKLAGKLASKDATAEIHATGKDMTRRASPLFLHIHEFSEGNYCGVASLHPAEFLKPDNKIEMKRLADKHTVPLPTNTSYTHIKNYLTQLGTGWREI